MANKAVSKARKAVVKAAMKISTLQPKLDWQDDKKFPALAEKLGGATAVLQEALTDLESADSDAADGI